MCHSRIVEMGIIIGDATSLSNHHSYMFSSLITLISIAKKNLRAPLLVNLLPVVQEALVKLETEAGIQATGSSANAVHAQLWDTDIGSLAPHGAAQHWADGAA